MRVPATRLRMAELAAAFSIVTDAARGLDEGQGIRSCVLAMRLADRLQLPPDDRTAVFWVGLLRYAGWTAGAAAAAPALDADITPETELALSSGSRSALWSAAVKAAGARPSKVSEFVRRAPGAFAIQRAVSSDASQAIAVNFGVAPRVVQALGQVFQRWDGAGEPDTRSGTEIDKAVRIWQVAHVADVIATATGSGRREVPAALRRRGARSLDPDFARALAAAADVLAVGNPAGVEELLALEPEPHVLIDRTDVDAVLPAFGAVADATAAYLTGHSDRVAQLAAAAATAAGLPPHDITLLRRAGWVHDVGRVAVSPRLWTPTRPLTDDELAETRAHAQHSRRLLAHTPRLAPLAAVAAVHHERLDGSGHPNGVRGTGLSRSAALLAAADAYVSAGEPRPDRPARPPAEQAYLLLGLARDGRLPHEAVDAVIAAVNGAG